MPNISNHQKLCSFFPATGTEPKLNLIIIYFSTGHLGSQCSVWPQSTKYCNSHFFLHIRQMLYNVQNKTSNVNCNISSNSTNECPVEIYATTLVSSACTLNWLGPLWPSTKSHTRKYYINTRKDRSESSVFGLSYVCVQLGVLCGNLLKCQVLMQSIFSQLQIYQNYQV